MKKVSTKYPPGTLLQNIHNPNVFRVCLDWYADDDDIEETEFIDTISPTKPRWAYKEKHLDEDYRIVSAEKPEDS